jgi:hypothetical protein
VIRQAKEAKQSPWTTPTQEVGHHAHLPVRQKVAEGYMVVPYQPDDSRSNEMEINADSMDQQTGNDAAQIANEVIMQVSLGKHLR